MHATKAKRVRAKAMPADPPLPDGLPTVARLPDRQFVVELERVVFDDAPDREPETIDPQRIAELAASMAHVGQLHPIGVTSDSGASGEGRGKGAWRVVYGRRRVLAARRLGWRSISAVELPYTGEADLIRAREVENIQRQDLNPAEEATAIARLLDLEAGEFSGRWDTIPKSEKVAVVDRVAAKLGKTGRWVRDRAFVARLDGPSRALVLSGKLTLARARLIAQIADPVRRDEMAHDAADGLLEDDEISDEVARQLRSLARAPWRLDVPFGGKPPCTACPANSANEPLLFGEMLRYNDSELGQRPSIAGGTPKAGVCLSASCFGEKQRLTEITIRGQVRRVSKAVADVKPKARTKALNEAIKVEAATEAHVSGERIREAVEARLKSRAEHDKKAKPPKSTPDDGKIRRAELEREWREIMRDRAARLEPLIVKALAARPGAWAMWRLLEQTRALQDTRVYSIEAAAKAAAKKELSRLLSLVSAPSFDAMLEIERACGRRYSILEPSDDGPSGVAEMLAEVLGIGLDDPRTSLEAFVASRSPKPAKFSRKEDVQ
ncbi:MAG: ParB/RepB/Spo0J family partition protein [Phycisphaerales bacterium]